MHQQTPLFSQVMFAVLHVLLNSSPQNNILSSHIIFIHVNTYPLHIVTSAWILALAKLLYKVPFASTLAKHLHIPIWSHIFQCQCAIGCYLVFQITIGEREILTKGILCRTTAGVGLLHERVQHSARWSHATRSASCRPYLAHTATVKHAPIWACSD